MTILQIKWTIAKLRSETNSKGTNIYFWSCTHFDGVPPSPSSSLLVQDCCISVPPPFIKISMLQLPSQHCRYKCAKDDLQKKRKLQKTSNYLKLVFTFNHMFLKPDKSRWVLSELLYKASLLVRFITLFFKANHLFWSKVVNYSLSLKAILQLYSTALDMHQKSASSFNESQIGPFVTEKINESSVQCMTCS